MPDIAGNSLGTATTLNLTTAAQSLQDTVTLTNSDFYRFVLTYRSSLNASLTGLSANANLTLLDRNGNPLQNSANPSTFAESINTPLEAGIYYLRVAPDGSTPSANYTLNVSIANTITPGFALRNTANGSDVLWQVTGGALTGTPALPTLPDLNWQLADTGDFNNDGNSDLVWRNTVTGANTVWFLSGTTYIGEAPLPALPDLNWQLAGTGDFNNDGNRDLVWRNTVTGANTVWFLNGTTYTGEAPLPALPDLNWKLQGIGDFNGDNNLDLVWRNTASGNNTAWFLNGTTYSGEASLPALPDLNWQFQGAGDYNSDGKPDLLVRNFSSGDNTIWLLNGTAYIGETALPPIADPNWQAKAPFLVVGTPPPIDTAGNTPATGFNLGSNLRGNATYAGAIGPTNAEDYYQFSIANRANLSLSLTGLAADLNLQLLSPDGTVLQASALGGLAPESINRQLEPGTYLARVFTPGGGNSAYTLGLGLGTVPVLVTNAGLSLTEGGTASLSRSLLTVTDPDVTTAQIVYTLGSLPTVGSLSLNGAPLLAGARFTQADLDAGTRLTYSHNGSETTADSFSFTVTDGVGGTIGSTPFTIGVTPVNDAPVLTVPTAPRSADQGAAVAISGISVTDVDAAAAEVTATVTANNGTLSLSSIAGLRFTQGDGTQDAALIFSGSLSAVNAAVQTLLYRSADTFSGTETISLRVDDNGNTGLGGNLFDSKTIAVQVTPINRPPVITLPAAQTAREDTRVTIPGISVADPDAGGGNVTASLSVLNGLVSLGSVAGVNVTLGTGTGDRNVVFSGPIGAVNAALNNLSYVGNKDFNGTDSILISVSDNGNTGNGVPLSDQRSLNIVVTPVNDAPVLTIPSPAAQVNENTTLSLGGISVQDVDAGNGNLTVSLAVTNGTVSVTNATGVTFSGTGSQGSSVIFSGTLLAINAALAGLSYRGNLNFSGSDSLTIDVSDNGNTGSGIALNDRQTIALDVVGVNSPPVIALPTAPAVNTATSAAIPGISISDPDAGSGNALVTIAAINGALTVQPSPNVTFLQNTTPTGTRLTFEGSLTAINQTLATLSYRSNPGFVGFEQIRVSVNDEGNTGVGPSLSDTKTLFVSVGGATNQLPIALNDSASVNQNSNLSGSSVLANDRDPDNNVPLSAQLVSGPTNAASFTLNPDGTFTYTPRTNFSGTDSFTYAARDQIGGASTPATVTIAVLAVNQAPIANNDSFSVNANATLPGNVVTNDSDPDNNLPLTAQVVTGPANAANFTLSSNGTFTYTPRANFSGSDSFVYRVSDSAGAQSNLATANIAIAAAANQPPIANNDSYTSNQTGVITPQQSVLFNDTDVDSTSLTAILVSNVSPSSGTVTLAPNGTFTYTPGTFTGTTSFTYKVNDGNSDSNTATVTIAVAQSNSAPTAANDSYSVSRAGVITPATSVLANDTDPDPGTTLTALSVAGPANALSFSLNPNGTFTYTPTTNFTGTDSFTYRANDGTINSSNTATVTLVVGVNSAPTAANDSYSVSRAGVVTPATSVLANDTDPDPGTTLTAVSVTAPASALSFSLNPNGTFTYTPTTGFTGTDSFTYRANDGTINSANLGTVTLVVGGNTAPSAANDSYSTSLNTPLTPTLSVLANDIDPDPATTLTAKLVDTVKSGTLTLNTATGTFTYSPNTGFAGTDSFTYRANDGTIDSANLGTVTIVVGGTAGVNTPPIARSDLYTDALAGRPYTVSTVLNGVLRNDTDAEGNPLTAVKASDPRNGSLTLSSNGTFVYTPTASFTGTDSFTYRANDGVTDSDLATVTIVVSNDTPPNAVNDSGYIVSRNQTLTIDTTRSVLNNDTDAETGRPTTAKLVNTVKSGTLTLNPDGTFVYTPTTGFLGTDSFTYRANDGILDSTSTATVLLTVIANTPPVVSNDNYTASRGLPRSINNLLGVLQNDSDAEGNPLTATVVTSVKNGTLSFNPDGSFVYTSNSTFLGTDSFTYRANDGSLDSLSVGTAFITVQANTAPIANSETYAFNTGQGRTIAAAQGVLKNDTDLEGNPLTAQLVSSVSNGSLNANLDGSFTYTPTAGFRGTDSFTYQVSDGSLLSSLATATLIVADNTAPVTQPDSFSVNRNNILTPSPTRNVLSNDTDVDVLTVTVVTPPPNGSLTLNSNGTFTYMPTTGFTGTDSFVYRASDGSLSSLGTAFITVNSTSRPPTATNDTYGNVNANSPYTVTIASGVLANDTDPDGDLLFATVGTAPTKGTVALNRDGSFVYTPTTANFIGTDSFTYTATDGINTTVPATVTLIVGAVNNPPVVAVPGSQVSFQGLDLVIPSGLSVSDVDAGTNPLSVTLVSTNGNLSLSTTANLTVTGNDTTAIGISGTQSAINAALVNFKYRPISPTFTGTDLITVTANDNGFTGGATLTPKTGTGTVTVNVTAGPTIVRDINTAPQPDGSTATSNPSNLTAVGNTVYFTANNGLTGVELWKSDGTEANTVQVANINPDGDASPASLTQVGNTLFFTADNGVAGRELWKVDLGTGTASIVKDLRPGVQSSNPTNLVSFNGALYFRANDGSGTTLWRTDGTDTGTVRLGNVSQPGSLTVAGSNLFFTLSSGQQLWRTTGSDSGTIVQDFGAGATISNLTPIGNSVFFTTVAGSGLTLWKSDGSTTTQQGTVSSTTTFLPDPVPLGNTLYFFTNLSGNYALAKSGSAGGITPVQTLPSFGGQAPTSLTLVGNTLFFVVDVGTAAAPARQLWKSDGSTASLVKDINPGDDANPTSLANLNGTLAFVAQDANGTELWRSDGTAAGTTPISAPFATNGNPAQLTAAAGKLYFTADTGSSGTELWAL